MAILEFFWRSLVAREVAKQIEVVFKITGGVTKFLRAQLSENSRDMCHGPFLLCSNEDVNKMPELYVLYMYCYRA